MDQIVENHSPEHLESLFDALFVYEHKLFSLLAKKNRNEMACYSAQTRNRWP